MVQHTDVWAQDGMVRDYQVGEAIDCTDGVQQRWAKSYARVARAGLAPALPRAVPRLRLVGYQTRSRVLLLDVAVDRVREISPSEYAIGLRDPLQPPVYRNPSVEANGQRDDTHNGIRGTNNYCIEVLLPRVVGSGPDGLRKEECTGDCSEECRYEDE